ncbi:MAG: nitroreductase family deazaflavin-dependent oxidoreductase [Actinobacteria bacterium]|nr:nitroreductase family deazaflavin-dependent oxidoreductase [Actinomycetota bacterium]
MSDVKSPRPFGGFERGAQKAVTELHKLIFRSTGGRVLGRIAGMPVLILHTTGRRSGQPREAVLTYTTDGDDLVVVASNGGTRSHPTWFLNLEADPEVEIEMGKGREKKRARRASAEEKQRLWPGITKTYEGYAGYQKRTERDIPLVILEDA